MTDEQKAEFRKLGSCAFAAIQEMVDNLKAARDDGSYDEQNAINTIEGDPLSVQVRSPWYAPGECLPPKPVEYEILLSTGGPATRIVGDLGEHGEPETATLQCQDWFLPWTDWTGDDDPNDKGARIDPQPVLLDYARYFYFGE